MTRKKIEKLKRQVLAERDRQSYEAIKNRRIPLWRRIASWMGNYKPEDKWLERWNKKHDAALRAATRSTLKTAISVSVAKETRKIISSVFSNSRR